MGNPEATYIIKILLKIKGGRLHIVYINLL